MSSNTLAHLQLYLRLGLTPIPLKPRSKEPLVRWRHNWNPSPSDLAPWASRPNLNWGVRCGDNLVALDFEDGDSFHRFVASHRLPPGCPIVRTGRGFHIWVKPRKPATTQYLDGVEVRGRGSYVVAPPSVHPNGARYVFEVAPDGAIPEVDLEELLGVLWEHRKHHAHTHIDTPVNGGTREEFGRLMGKLGVFPGENPTWCFAHDDHREGGMRSLAVDWEGCRFKCFSPRCGIHGGIGTLRKLAGETPPFVGSISSCGQKGVSEHDRLVSALRDAGEYDAAEAVNSCHREFRVYRCQACGKTPAYPVSCGFPLCPECLGTRFFAFWDRHKDTLKGPLALVQLIPNGSFPLSKQSMKKVRDRFGEWRERRKLERGLYALVPMVEADDCRINVLLVIPQSELCKMERGRAFQVRVAGYSTEQEARRWLVDALLEGATSWRSADEMIALWTMLRGTPLVFGFGQWHKVRGGRAKGITQNKPRCPFCGGDLVPLGLVPPDSVAIEEGHPVWRPPPIKGGANP